MMPCFHFHFISFFISSLFHDYISFHYFAAVFSIFLRHFHFFSRFIIISLIFLFSPLISIISITLRCFSSSYSPYHFAIIFTLFSLADFFIDLPAAAADTFSAAS